MDRVGIENESVKINRFTIFSLTVLTVLFIFFRQYGYLRMPALEALFPVSTSVILVLHGLLALFMLMKFNFERNHLYLVVLAFVYGISSIYLVSKLLSYPGIMFTEGGLGTNANDMAIYFIFRSATMAILILFSLLVYRLRHKSFINIYLVFGSCLFLSSLSLLLAYFVSSHSEVLALSIVDEKHLTYDNFWSSAIGLYLVILWGVTSSSVIFFAGARSGFWASLSLSCIAFLGSTLLLSGSNYLASLAWYGAHLFEVLATFIVMLAFLFDIFKLYQKARSDYQISYDNSIRDPMTRLYNRSYYYDTLIQRMKTVSEQEPITLLIADVDHFKRVNDVYGHVTGDRVIQYVAKTLEHSIRKTDIAARIGGEEFSILLNGVGRAEAVLLADRVRLSISDHVNSPFGQDVPDKVTISIGVYTITDKELTAEECVTFADAAMYQAKQEGRNRVVLYSAKASELMSNKNRVLLERVHA